MGEVKVYTRFTKGLHQTAFSAKLLVLQLKSAPFPSSTLSLTISFTHTKQVKIYVQSTGQTKHTFNFQKQQFGFHGKFNTLALKPTETEPSFRKLNSSPTKLGMLFPAHLQAREVMSTNFHCP